MTSFNKVKLLCNMDKTPNKNSSKKKTIKLKLRSHFFLGVFDFVVSYQCRIRAIKMVVLKSHYSPLVANNQTVIEELTNYHRIMAIKKHNSKICGSHHLRDSLTVQEAKLENNDELFLMRILPALNPIKKMKTKGQLEYDEIQDKLLDSEVERQMQEHNTLNSKLQITPNLFFEMQLPEFGSDMRRIITTFFEIVITVLSTMNTYPKAKSTLEILRNEMINTMYPSDLNQAYIIEFRDKGYSAHRTKYAFYMSRFRPSEALEWLINNKSIESVDIPDESEMPTITTRAELLQTPVTDTERMLRLFKEYKNFKFKPDKFALKNLLDMSYEKQDIISALNESENSYPIAFRFLSGERSPSMEDMEHIPYPNRIYYSISEKVLRHQMFNAKVLLALLSFFKSPEEIVFGWCFDREIAPVIFELFEIYHQETQDIYHCETKYEEEN